MTGLVLQKTPLRQVGDVRQLLMNEQARDQLAAVAAKHMSPERMMRVVANAIRTTPKLQKCEPMSFLGALMQCAALGLEPNTILGHAYLIPFDKTLNRGKPNETVVTELQLVVGYKGLIDLARRSGHITSMNAGIHYSDDELWDYEEGTEARLRHKPGPEAGTKLHAYAIAKFKDGGHAYVVLPWARVLRIRDGSQGYQNAVRTATKYKKPVDSPWVKYEDEMAKKTAIRALSKYLPLSVEFMDALNVDEARADYRAFAMDPTGGVITEEDDGNTIDGEVSEPDPKPEAVKPKSDPKPKADPKPEPEKKAAESEAKAEAQAQAAEAEAKPDATTDDPVTDLVSGKDDEKAAEPETDGDLLNTPFAQEVLRDAADFGETAARATHAGQLAYLAENDKPMFAAIDAELKRIGG